MLVQGKPELFWQQLLTSLSIDERVFFIGDPDEASLHPEYPLKNM